MTHHFADIAFTPTVQKFQEELGSRGAYAKMQNTAAEVNHSLGEAEAGFIAARNSFYMATVSETGWPYIQHRGGPTGFVRVLDEHSIGFADFRGNRQYVSLGNLAKDDRVSLFFMDYPNRRRLKLFGRVQIVEPSNEAALARLEIPDYRARVERGMIISIEGFDWNCPQHIAQRYTREEAFALTEPLSARIAELEAELEQLRALR